jgi:uncharacterized protein involved in exopolysaccharide biosynthesis
MTHQSAASEAELSFHDFAAVLREWRWWIALVVVLTTVVVGGFSFILPKKYEGVVLISPVANTSENSMMSGLSAMASQMSGLASLAGISEHSDTVKAESLAVLESEALTEQYIKDNDLLPLLYPGKWDAQAHRWRVSNPRDIPTLWTANQYFKKKVRRVSPDAKTGLTTVTITWSDPVTAAKWANDLVKLANEYRRAKAIDESERNIAYLTTEATKTDVLGVRQAIYSVLQSEISRMMLAKGNDEYALKVIDPARAPEKPTSPIPLYWILSAFAASLGTCLMMAFARVALAHRQPVRR